MPPYGKDIYLGGFLYDLNLSPVLLSEIPQRFNDLGIIPMNVFKSQPFWNYHIIHVYAILVMDANLIFLVNFLHLSF